jgi:hypothetical protein
VTLLALLMYSLTLLRRLLRTGLSASDLTTAGADDADGADRSAADRTLLEGLRYVWQRVHCPPAQPKDEDDETRRPLGDLSATR